MTDTTDPGELLTARLAAAAPEDELDRDQVLARVQRGLLLRENDPVRIGPFTVLRRIGAGGMGVVYAAYDPRLDRRVALKLLHGAGTGEAQVRLQREAKTLARLSHPNVVAVHEIGEYDGRSYVAMEFVDGTDLRGWLQRGRRSWAEVVATFSLAGRGLAAAHGAGLVHRDFKPENVLMDDDGVVRVADFGLARALASPAALADGDERWPPTQEMGPAASLRITQTGAMVGTPAYMAPEQLRGEAADTRSDQYAFCVALYEALFGRRPFKATNLHALTAEVMEGPAEPPRDLRVPIWLRRAVMRGLATDPAARHPSMDALVAQLTQDRVGRRRNLVVVGAAAGALLVGGWVTLAEDDASCTGFDAKTRPIWNASRRDALTAAFVETEHPGAAKMAAGVSERVDQYVAAWVGTRAAACSATHTTGQQSDTLLARQVLCLERGLLSLEATLSELMVADRALVSRAYDPIPSVNAVKQCAGEEALLEGVAPPRGESARAELAAADELWARGVASRDAGHPRDGRELLSAALARAQAVGHAPTEARIVFDLGIAARDLGEYESIVDAQRRAVQLADRGAADVIRARALALLARGLAGLGRHDEASDNLARAQAAFARLGTARTEWTLLLEVTAGVLTIERDDWLGALFHYGRVLDATRGATGDSLDFVLTAASGLGETSFARGLYRDALEWNTLAHETALARLGEHHPQTAQTLANLGATLLSLGELDRAAASFEASLRSRLLYMPADDVRMRPLYQNLGVAEFKRDRYHAALDRFEAAMQLAGDDPRVRAGLLTNIGSVHTRLGDFAKALGVHRESLRLRKADPSTPARQLANSEYAVANDLFQLGRYPEALTAYVSCRDRFAAAQGSRDPRLAEPLVGMADTLMELHRPTDALRRAQDAYAFVDHPDLSPEVQASIELAVARAMVRAGRPRAEARPFVESARERVRSLGPANPRRVMIDAWLAGG